MDKTNPPRGFSPLVFVSENDEVNAFEAYSAIRHSASTALCSN